MRLWSGSESRESMETLLTEFVRQMNVKLILITESVAVSFLDYIVDAIITIKDETIDGRVLRIIEINKIRAIERSTKGIYIYTISESF